VVCGLYVDTMKENTEAYKLNIVRNGVMMAVYVFIVVVLYIIISSPFNDIMSSYEDVNLTSSDAEVEQGASMGRTVFDIIFAMFILIPIIWFVFMCFYREPDWRE
jgi:hypothetical protein